MNLLRRKHFWLSLTVLLLTLVLPEPTFGQATPCGPFVAEASSYRLVYTLPIPLNADYDDGRPPYSVDNAASIGSFDRIAYCLQLNDSWVWVSMNAFTTVPARVGVPVISTGMVFQQRVSNMNVFSNVPSIVTGTGLTTGNIEFWHQCYNTDAFVGLPGASSTVYDFDDSIRTPGESCYGSMQVHNHGTGPNLPQTLFAYNSWDHAAADDLGIGNSPASDGNSDWTFAFNAETYNVRTLHIFVADTKAPAVSAVNTTSITAFAALVNWTTDEESDTQVEYGTTTAYGSTTALNSTLATSHSANLTGLFSNTTYHFRVKSKDAAGNLATGTDNTFVTSFSISDRGGASRATDGSGDLTVGYGRIRADAGSTTPSGLAIFGYRQSGVLISEAGVPDSPLITSGRIYAEVSADGIVNTGLAIANPNSQSATIDFIFRDTNGTIFRTGSTPVGANGQITRFLDQAPFSSGRGIQGTFSFTSNVPVSVIALRGFYNERTPSEFLLTTLPILDLSTSASTGTQVVPHFAVGGGWTTQIVLVNPTSADQSGTLQFLDASGAPVSVSINGAIASSNGSYSVKADSSQTLVITPASASQDGGTVRIAPPTAGSATPTPLAIFTYKQGGVTLSEAGVPVTMGAAFRMYVELAPSTRISSGIAIANATAVAGTVTLSVTGLDGSAVATSAPLPLPASGQLVGFLNEFFPALASQPLQGVLRITTTASSISVVGLRLRYNERGDFMLTTTPPTIENSAPGLADRFFPQLANGGGYTTQFILFSGTSGQVSSGSLSFITQGGTTLSLNIN